MRHDCQNHLPVDNSHFGHPKISFGKIDLGLSGVCVDPGSQVIKIVKVRQSHEPVANPGLHFPK